jgi:pimeloyl-ACP methyl ester carboxylesterase
LNAAEFYCPWPPKTLIFWDQNDIFFTPAGGEAYLRDLPDAEMHRLDSGHFALEDCLDEIAAGIRRFYDERVGSSLRPVVEKIS